MNNGRPLSKRKTVQLMILLTILAWATQTLFHQWGFGQEIALSGDAQAAEPAPEAPLEATASEKFMPAEPHAPCGTLELRPEAAVLSADVKLKQLCRWSDADAGVFAPVADLTVAKVTEQTPYRQVSLDDIRQTLHDAGMNLTMVRFAGATACTVSRADVQGDDRTSLEAWAQGRQEAAAAEASPIAADAKTPGSKFPTASVTPIAPKAAPATDDKPDRSLRAQLTADLCQRLNLSRDALQITFDPQDERVLNLAEPLFQFSITPERVRDLGQVSWDVKFISGSNSKKVNITATARAWQDEVVVAKSLAYQQVIRDSDVVDRRTLVDRLPDEILMTRAQVVGQQAGRDLKPGVVVTGRMVEPVPLAKAGDLVTVTATRGSVSVRTVARALEGGSFGQSIKVRNDTTRETFDAVLTGPQEARLGGGSAPATHVASTDN